MFRTHRPSQFQIHILSCALQTKAQGHCSGHDHAGSDSVGIMDLNICTAQTLLQKAHQFQMSDKLHRAILGKTHPDPDTDVLRRIHRFCRLC